MELASLLAETWPPPAGLSARELELRRRLVESLAQQGFSFVDGRVQPPLIKNKLAVRNLHSPAVSHRIAKAKRGLQRHEDGLLEWIANGDEIVLERISPRLVEVDRGSANELLFRYAALHWSIPVSSGYGRRLRFLVIDDSNQKLIGLIGLGDPVMNLGPRDAYIGWQRDARHARLHHLMDAFVLGAVPPYSHLLAGKLVAMLSASEEAREVFEAKYGGRTSVINRRALGGELAAITTLSALGRSSLYNRLNARDGSKLCRSVGFTSGYGEFHFVNGLYSSLQEQATARTAPTARAAAWGSGFRNRREVIKKGLVSLGLPTDLIRHGIRREVFIIPHAENLREFLRGEADRLVPTTTSLEDLAAWWRERWLLPRRHRLAALKGFHRESYRLWGRE